LKAKLIRKIEKIFTLRGAVFNNLDEIVDFVFLFAQICISKILICVFYCNFNLYLIVCLLLLQIGALDWCSPCGDAGHLGGRVRPGERRAHELAAATQRPGALPARRLAHPQGRSLGRKEVQRRDGLRKCHRRRRQRPRPTSHPHGQIYFFKSKTNF